MRQRTLDELRRAVDELIRQRAAIEARAGETTAEWARIRHDTAIVAEPSVAALRELIAECRKKIEF